MVVAVESEQRDSVVIVGRVIIIAPLLPFCLPLFGQQFGAGETFRKSELSRAVARQHHVFAVFHNATSYRDRMQDILKSGDAAGAMALAVHDAGIKLDYALGVGNAAQADRGIANIGFGDVDTSLNGVE